MASHILVDRIHEERRIEAAEHRLAAATTTSPRSRVRSRLTREARVRLGRWLVALGEGLAGDGVRRRTSWSEPVRRRA